MPGVSPGLQITLSQARSEPLYIQSVDPFNFMLNRALFELRHIYNSIIPKENLQKALGVSWRRLNHAAGNSINLPNLCPFYESLQEPHRQRNNLSDYRRAPSISFHQPSSRLPSTILIILPTEFPLVFLNSLSPHPKSRKKKKKKISSLTSQPTPPLFHRNLPPPPPSPTGLCHKTRIGRYTKDSWLSLS